MRPISAFLLLFVLAPGYLLAQAPPPKIPADPAPASSDPKIPIFSGFVRYADSYETASNVLVKLETENGSWVADSFTRDSGRFEFFQVPFGEYYLVVKLDGFKEVRERVRFDYSPVMGLQLNLVRKEKEEEKVGGHSVSLRDLQIPPEAREEFEKGQESLARQEHEEGLEHLRKAIEIHSGYDEAYVQIGLIHLERNELAVAEAVLLKALEVYAGNDRALTALGAVYRTGGQGEKARQALEKALEMQERSWMAHSELGRALLVSGDLEGALAHIDRAHELNASMASIHLLLYNAHLMRNDYESALAEVIEFLDLFPQHTLAAEARDMRQKIEDRLFGFPQ